MQHRETHLRMDALAPADMLKKEYGVAPQPFHTIRASAVGIYISIVRRKCKTRGVGVFKSACSLQIQRSFTDIAAPRGLI